MGYCRGVEQMNTREKMLILLARRPMTTYEIAETLGMSKNFALDGLHHLRDEGAIYCGEPEKVEWSRKKASRWHLNLDCIKPSAREVLGPLFTVMQQGPCTKTELVNKCGMHHQAVTKRIDRARELGGLIYISEYIGTDKENPRYALGDKKDAVRFVTTDHLQNVWR